MIKGKLNFLIKPISKVVLLIMTGALAFFISLRGLPVQNDSFICRDVNDNVIMEKVGKYYVPYIKKSNNLFIKASDTPIDIISRNEIEFIDGKFISSSDKESNSLSFRIPTKDVVVILTQENMNKVKNDLQISDFSSSDLKCVVGKRNLIWFKNTKTFIVIDNEISCITVKTNENSGNLFLDFIKHGEKYAVLFVSGDLIDLNNSSIENIEILRENNLLSERALFSNFYYFTTHNIDKIMNSYGIELGSIIIMLIMLMCFGLFGVYNNIKRSETNKNKSIEIEIAKSEFASNPQRLEDEINRINEAYGTKDWWRSLSTFALFFVENYIILRIIGDYTLVRGILFGSNDLGMPEVVNLSNLFGLLSAPYFYRIGPIAILVSCVFSWVVDKTSNIPTDDDSTGSSSSDLLKVLQPLIFLYIFSSRPLYFLIFYLVYSLLKHGVYLAILSIRSKNPVRFVK